VKRGPSKGGSLPSDLSPGFLYTWKSTHSLSTTGWQLMTHKLLKVWCLRCVVGPTNQIYNNPLPWCLKQNCEKIERKGNFTFRMKFALVWGVHAYKTRGALFSKPLVKRKTLDSLHLVEFIWVKNDSWIRQHSESESESESENIRGASVQSMSIYRQKHGHKGRNSVVGYSSVFDQLAACD
jgi:hypothetical protein